ncbi:MAG: bifunctional dihydropteridine reductase/dihydrofolate reductase TmpR [Leptolyngbyaceae bacterium]|nr:bifunctional dihydropteridine reductase/dihydrofolate reductase TmpR [Leptolyngbyaceae bacterium]
MVTKKALVTGSAKGIGRAIALKLAQEGFDIAFHYRSSGAAAQQACQAATQFGVKAIALQADITQPDQAATLVEQTAAQLGGLSVVVNAVGDYLRQRTSEMTVEQWHSVMASNLHSAFYITQTAIPHLKMAQWGRIINIAAASAQNLTARQLNTGYIIAKTGIIIYTKSLAQELIKDNITANVIAPGVAENSFEYDDDWEYDLPKLPAGRPATLSEVSHAAWFFVNPDSDYITGQVLEVSGGWSL